MRVTRLLPVLLVAAAVATSCAARAEVLTPTGQPPLEPPPPPARVVVPAPELPTVPPTAESAPPPPASSSSASAPTRPRDVSSTAKPSAPVTDPAPAPQVLQTTANAQEFEQRIRATIARAETGLNKVDARALGANARAQYDAARGFIRQAEAALKVKNLIYASQLADKAATLASLLRR